MHITNKSELDARIAELESKQKSKEDQLRIKINELKESLSPLNIIKSGITKFSSSSQLPGLFAKIIMGAGVAWASKKVYKSSDRPGSIRQILVQLIEQGIASVFIQHSDKIKAYGIAVYHALFSKTKNNKPQPETDIE